jgi:periplasmic protein TonB
MKKILSLVLCLAISSILAQAPMSIVKSIPISYDKVEIKPSFPGGKNAFLNFIAKNFHAPEEEGLSGVVKVSFIIETNGSISEIKTISDIGSGSGKEAERVLLQCPKWVAGEEQGKSVRVIYVLPITVQTN